MVDTPVATVPVSITGSGVVDSTLTLNPAQWNMPNNVLTITYQWFRGTSAVTGATGVTYEVTSADIGKAITVQATATRPGYTTGTSTSNAITGTQAGAPLAAVPVVINGTGLYGSTLDADPADVGRRRRDDHLPVVPRTPPRVAARPARRTSWAPPTWRKDITVKATGTKAGYANGSLGQQRGHRGAEPGPGGHHPGRPSRGTRRRSGSR